MCKGRGEVVSEFLIRTHKSQKNERKKKVKKLKENKIVNTDPRSSQSKAEIKVF